jgi:hypothetical protein
MSVLFINGDANADVQSLVMTDQDDKVVLEEQFQLEQGNAVLFPKEFERQSYHLQIYLDGESNGSLEGRIESPSWNCGEPTIWITLNQNSANFELNCTLPPNKSVIDNRSR